MATKSEVREALATLTAAGFSVTLESASGKSITRGPQPSPPPAPKKARKTKAERSAAQPKVKHCSKCGEPGHNAATCERRKRAAAAAAATPTVDMTSALLDGLPQQATRRAAPPPPAPAPAEDGFLDLGF